MKFSVGYQLPDEYDCIADIVSDHREHISSVYFSPPGKNSARTVIEDKYSPYMMEELRYIRDMGVGLTMLYNANCYGGRAVCSEFGKEIAATVEQMLRQLDIGEITTTSPFVAQVVKKEFPQIKICASVNMWIGTTQAMEYLGDYFDGYYMQREYNRDLRKLKELSAWCNRHGKQLKMLANSGCLYTCPFHMFHDNLVAHEAEACLLDNAMSSQPSPCWDLMYSKKAVDAAATFLQESWIFPKDIHRYEPYVSEVKLATRMHYNPRRVVSAYVRGRFVGNMLDLTEPSYSRRFQEYILDATKFPSDWFEKTTNCSKNCDACGYCKEVAKQVMVSKRELEKLYLQGSTE